MGEKAKHEAISWKARIDLPEPFLTEVGRVIVQWSFFEQLVQSLVRQQIDLSPPEARLALREPRVTERLELLQDLMTLHQGTWNSELYNSIYTRAKRWATRRDLFAHSIWGRNETTGTWHIQVVRGKWTKHLEEQFRGHRRVMPAALEITINHLLIANKSIASLIDDIERLKTSASWRRSL